MSYKLLIGGSDALLISPGNYLVTQTSAPTSAAKPMRRLGFGITLGLAFALKLWGVLHG